MRALFFDGAALSCVDRPPPPVGTGEALVHLRLAGICSTDLQMATGSPDGLALAVAAVRPRGTLVLKSTVAQPHSLALAPLVINEISVVGSRCGLFPPALAALTARSVTVSPLVDATYPLAGGVDALAHAALPGVRKVLLYNE